jgi:hypothetical protein
MLAHAFASTRQSLITATTRIPVALVAQQQKVAETQAILRNAMFHEMFHCVAERLHRVAQR